MADAFADRRASTRHPLILVAEIYELPEGPRTSARTSDVSRTGCYIDTLNPLPRGAHLNVKLHHGNEVFEGTGRVMYASHGLGMGILFDSEVSPSQCAILDRWLNSFSRVRV